MNTFYLFLIIILFILAFSDLFVGVANDAVNFLNSAIGAKAASFKAVMIVASAGLIIGATFSSGLMEIARKGLFYPTMFSFSDVMVIFLAVMIADVILLDIFNTFGLPTSTTVSIVFDLLGASVGVALLKISESDQTLQDLGLYINSGKALAIITGILVSVALAFTVGAFIQYITRILFTFNIRHNLKYFASLWGAMAITGIVYFLIIKGAKGASFVTAEHLKYINEHTFRIMFFCFLILTIILQVCITLFKLNVLRLVVLTGTFALALAFAGNDMVNFIGVPLAGLKSYQLFVSTPGADPHTFMMSGLNEDVITETWILLIAGIFMVFTIWTSKKAKTVIQTSVDLSRQQEGVERFNSSILSRNLVRGAIKMSNAISKFLPSNITTWIERRFDEPDSITKEQMPKGAAFDMLRASVNLVVASVLIAIGTSLKLPLSTTYVTFMVAMGTSLSDRAWGRESAVYRITGVLSVIGGWFFTALAAFTFAIIAATIIYLGGLPAILLLMALSIFMVYRTHVIHLRRSNIEKEETAREVINTNLTTDSIITRSTKNIQDVLKIIISILNDTIAGLADEDRKALKNAKAAVQQLNNTTKKWKTSVSTVLANLKEDTGTETGHYYVQSIDYLREINHCISYIVTPSYEHIENNHKSLITSQIEEISRIQAEVTIFTEEIISMLERYSFEDFDLIVDRQQGIIRLLDDSRKKQIKRIKNSETGTRNSVLYLNILAELRNLSLFAVNLLKTERDFVSVSRSRSEKN